MKLEFHIEGGLIESLELMGERAADPGPPLRKWGAWKRKQVKEAIESEEGFAPLAASTLLKRQRTRTGRVTRHGHLRSAYTKRLDARSKRIQGLIAWSQRRYLGLGRLLGPSAGIQKKVARWQKELEAINRQLRRAQDQGFAGTKSGKSVAEKKGTKIFPKLPSTIRVKVVAKDGHGTCAVGSAAGAIGKVHNEGGSAGHGAQIPARPFLVLTAKDVQVARQFLVAHGISVLTERR